MKSLVFLLLAFLFTLPATVQSTPAPDPGPTPTQRARKKSSEIDSGQRTKRGKKIYVGPRGGRYHYSKNGKKVYEKKRRRPGQ